MRACRARPLSQADGHSVFRRECMFSAKPSGASVRVLAALAGPQQPVQCEISREHCAGSGGALAACAVEGPWNGLAQ